MNIKRLAVVLTIKDRYPRTWKWTKRITLSISETVFWLVVLVNVVSLIWNIDMHGAGDRGLAVALLVIGCANLARYSDMIHTHLDRKLARLRKQVAEQKVTTVEIPEGMGGLMLMQCPACHDMVSLDDMTEHVEEHLTTLRDPAHEGQPVAMLLRRPGATEWQKIPVIDRG